MDKARSKILNQIISIEDYLNYVEKNKKFEDIIKNNLTCPICGKEVNIANGDINIPHFRHKKTTEEYYCPLYVDGSNINCKEVDIRDILSKEIDISFTYELGFSYGKWHSYITLPRFKSKNLEQMTQENLKLKILKNRAYISLIDLNYNVLSPGEIKRIEIDNFPDMIDLSIEGKVSVEKKKIINILLEGLKPSSQIYSYILLQEYSSDGNGKINLNKIGNILTKRINGNVLVGKHYLIIEPKFRDINKVFKNLDAEIREFIFKSNNFNSYRVFDICFNSVTKTNYDFCFNRKCTLIQKNKIGLLWPPSITIGENKYCTLGKELFAVSENNSDEELCKLNIENLSYNLNDRTNELYYVKKINNDEIQLIWENKLKAYKGCSVEIKDRYEYSDKPNYLFKNDVLIKRNYDDVDLTDNNEVLEFTNRLHSTCFRLERKKQGINNNRILDYIRYGYRYVSFGKREYDVLCSLNPSSILREYLDICLEYGKIKYEVLEVFMEGKL